MRTAAINVAVNIVRAPDGRLLMAERTAGQLSAGLWELPGGKIDIGETPEQAAIRELDEEIGIRALTLRPWLTYEHAFRLRRIRVHSFCVDRWNGIPSGREGQRIGWVNPAAPNVLPILPSIQRIMSSLGLPSLYAVCGICDGGLTRTLDDIGRALRGGVRLLQLHGPDMTPDQRVSWARRVNAIAAPAGADVLMVGSALEARRADVSGLHSTAQELKRLRARPPVRLWICSCHDANDLARASALGADAAVVGPIFSTAEHPAANAMNWEGLRRLSGQARLPLYGQGGLDATSIEAAQRAGAIGVATSNWRDPSPISQASRFNVYCDRTA